MPSPFPGMDPYLEQPDVWPDFHARFIAAMAVEIGRRVRPRYFVRIEEQVYLHERSAEERTPLGRPDIGVHSANRSSNTVLTESSSSPMTVYVPAGIDEIAIRHLEIRDAANRHLVTAIELLSPTNKRTGPDRELYWSKVRQLLQSTAHFVELDLLRGGPRMPWEGMPNCDYCAIVSRAERRPEVDCWPIHLRAPLPVLPVPLTSGDPDALLDLQSVLHRVYDDAAYDLSIYSGTPSPQLVPNDESWARSVLVTAVAES
jgi:Protein of unknown function (DUF4058)